MRIWECCAQTSQVVVRSDGHVDTLRAAAAVQRQHLGAMPQYQLHACGQALSLVMLYVFTQKTWNMLVQRAHGQATTLRDTSMASKFVDSVEHGVPQGKTLGT